jgi:hypothetical protein
MNVAPSSLLTSNPMHVYINSSSFSDNNGLTKAIIVTKTNSIMTVSNSTFIENYSSGKGSVVLADESAS